MARKSPLSLEAIRRNQSGQAMGAKGLKTRLRLIEATDELLKTKSLRDLTVSDIARMANTSASTFYLYFSDVPEAVLGAIRGVSQSTPELLELLEAPWTAEDLQQHAEAFVHTYVDNWKAHSHLFRMRNMTADEGDARFETVRRLSVSPLLDALAGRIAQNPGGAAFLGPGAVDPMSAAAALVAMIERLASIPTTSFVGSKVTYQSVLKAAAYFVSCALGPTQDPSRAQARRSGMDVDAQAQV